MIKLERFDWDRSQNVSYRANDRVVEKFCNWMLNSKAWHDNPELLMKRVREFRRDAEYVKEEPRQGAQARV